MSMSISISACISVSTTLTLSYLGVYGWSLVRGSMMQNCCFWVSLGALAKSRKLLHLSWEDTVDDRNRHGLNHTKTIEIMIS